jgi:hypothetical protein
LRRLIQGYLDPRSVEGPFGARMVGDDGIRGPDEVNAASGAWRAASGR